MQRALTEAAVRTALAEYLGVRVPDERVLIHADPIVSNVFAVRAFLRLDDAADFLVTGPTADDVEEVMLESWPPKRATPLNPLALFRVS